MKYLNIFLAVVILSIYSCSKSIVPKEVAGIKGDYYDEASFNYVYVEAIKQKIMGNLGDALKYLEQSLKINPESDASYYQMAQIVISNGDTENAKRFANKAYSLDNDNIWYVMMLAGIYYQEKNIDSAILFYEKAVMLKPDNQSVRINLGNLYTENKEYDKAKETFSFLDQKYGINETNSLAELKNMLAAENYDEALNKVNLLLKESPDEILYNNILAVIYKIKGDNQKALEVYEGLIKRNPDDPQVLLSYCDFLIDNKDYDELFIQLNAVILNDKIATDDKISLFAKLMELTDLKEEHSDKLLLSILVLEVNYPEDNIIPLLRPDYLVRHGKLEEAAGRLEEIVKEKPENYFAWEKLLIIYSQLRNFEKLMIKGEECATLFNRSFIAKILYANGATEMGKYIIALEELRKAEILAGDNKEYIVQVLTMRADVYYRQKEFQKAFEVFEDALKYNSDDIIILNNYAYYLAEQNMKLKEAEDMAKKVIEREKTNTTYLDTYAWVLYKRGKFNEASRIMETIISSGERENAEWYEHYGYILKKQKKCAKAIEYWNLALKIDSTRTGLLKEIENCKK